MVTVSSGAHAQGRLDFNDLQGEGNYSGQHAYSQSKLANVMFTYQLTRRLEGTGVTATAARPGVVATSFSTEDHAAHLGIMIRVGAAPHEHPVSGSAHPGLPCLLTRGRGRHRPVHRPPQAQGLQQASCDTAAAARLWQASAALTGLTAAA